MKRYTEHLWVPKFPAEILVGNDENKVAQNNEFLNEQVSLEAAKFFEIMT